MPKLGGFVLLYNIYNQLGTNFIIRKKMKNESVPNLLAENLIELGLDPDTHISNKTFIIPGSDRFLNTKFVVALLADSIYFLASDSFGTKAYASSTYTGLYSSIDLPIEAECKILKKDWFDTIFYFKKRKTGIKYIDEQLTIISSDWVPSKELKLESVNLFLALNKKGNPYNLIIQNDYLTKISSLNGKKIIGVETNQWIYQKEDIKCLIDLGSELINNIKKASA